MGFNISFKVFEMFYFITLFFIKLFIKLFFRLAVIRKVRIEIIIRAVKF